ncbi:MAG: GNAT family N-acetyltransferase [Clostridia bacterium]|nr:GNAT family N-acetyltransferase [Clostridia bacterium]
MFEIQNLQQITEIYNNYMFFDFPKDELKPLAHILSMVEDGTCTFYALKNDKEVLSYFSLCQNGDGVLVDYLAVNQKFRGQGIGSKTLEFLKSIAKNKYIIIECEDIAKAQTVQEKEIRTRRINFYQKAGFSLAGVNANLFGVEYTILTYPTNITKSKTKELYSTIYLRMLGKSMYDKFMKI